MQGTYVRTCAKLFFSLTISRLDHNMFFARSKFSFARLYHMTAIFLLSFCKLRYTKILLTGHAEFRGSSRAASVHYQCTKILIYRVLFLPKYNNYELTNLNQSDLFVLYWTCSQILRHSGRFSLLRSPENGWDHERPQKFVPFDRQ